jgi:GTP-binding protein Era
MSESKFKSGYVALAGRPNVGKSTLINAIVGESLAIVTEKPQTTRHRICGILSDDEAQIILLDTPGYHLSTKPLNAAMNDIVGAVIRDADVVCLMVPADARDFQIEKRLFDIAGSDRTIVVVNKGDLLARDRFESTALRFRDEWGAKEVAIISALKCEGVGDLIGIIKQRLPEGPEYFSKELYTDHSVRFLVAELIRRQLFLQMHQEIPYAAAVEIESFLDATENDLITRIKASIVVEKESQKAMIIGRNGTRIKELGKKSRQDIEELVDGKVFLELFVKVEKNWTRDPQKLRALGYSNQTD